MNFISHLFLSGNDQGLIVGNFIADSVKGKRYIDYNPEVQVGILLHRRIDTFTDTHEIVKKSKRIFQPNFNHFSGIIVDIIYDHFLVSQWQKFSSEELITFSERVINILESNKSTFPLHPLQFLTYIKRYNRIEGYGRIETLKSVLNGMARRSSYKIRLEEAVTELKDHYDELKTDFNNFFPLLHQYSQEETQNLNTQYIFLRDGKSGS